VEDPTPYLAEKKIRVPCAVRPELEASLDPALRVRINHENFLFSSAAAMAAFEADPLRYVDRLTDPVTRVRFQPLVDSPKFEDVDQTWYFASEESRSTFLVEPGRFNWLDGHAWMR
jgi:YHS domain-containing protein